MLRLRVRCGGLGCDEDARYNLGARCCIARRFSFVRVELNLWGRLPRPEHGGISKPARVLGSPRCGYRCGRANRRAFVGGELMDYKKIAGVAMVAIGGADLMLGNTSTPLPILGDYLTQQLDMVLIAGGLVLLFFF